MLIVCFWLFHQVPDGATVALVPRHTKHIHHDNHDYVAGESELTHKQFCYYNNRSKSVSLHSDHTATWKLSVAIKALSLI